MLEDMTIQRMDNVGIVVDDLDAAVAFFAELGMELEGKGQIEGLWADRTVGLDDTVARLRAARPVRRPQSMCGPSPSTAAMKPSGSTRLMTSELTLILRKIVLGFRDV